MNEIEETWSPEPVKAWRYFWVGPLTWNWAEDRWEVMLRGDFEEWSGPVKYAGHHTDDEVYNGQYFERVDHDSPHLGCMCGINAVKQLESSQLWHRQHGDEGQPPRAIAVSPVELAGIVDEYERGYRAQQAAIIGPITLFGGTDKQAQVLADNYGVEVTQDWWDLLRQVQSEERKQRDQEEQSGHRKADTSDHRGTGTSQDPGAGKGTSKGWRKVRRVGRVVSLGVAIWAVIFGIGVGIYALGDAINGPTDDAQCQILATDTGGTVTGADDFGECYVNWPNGLEVTGDGIYGLLPKSSAK